MAYEDSGAAYASTLAPIHYTLGNSRPTGEPKRGVEWTRVCMRVSEASNGIPERPQWLVWVV